MATAPVVHMHTCTCAHVHMHMHMHVCTHVWHRLHAQSAGGRPPDREPLETTGKAETLKASSPQLIFFSHFSVTMSAYGRVMSLGNGGIADLGTDGRALSARRGCYYS